MSMTLFEALEVLAAHRGDRIVVTAMSAVELWPQISDTPLDFNYLPSTMGQAPALGLGLSLSQPERGVIVVNGDGCLLMNLGCLVTIASHPTNLYLIIVDNGHYEATGGQPTAGSGRIDFPGLASAAGISRVYSFGDQESWGQGVEQALRGDGPVFISLKVEPVFGRKTPKPPRPMAEQIDRLKQALAVSRDSDL